MLEFSARLTDNDALLSWKTENEINTNEFVVERSINGSNNYTATGKVKSANTPGLHNYSFRDANITKQASDVIHYRLKQRDIDGRFTYSKVVTLTFRNKPNLVLYPNPAAHQVRLTISAQRKEKLNYRVFDNAGRLVMEQASMVLAGANVFSIDITKLSSGLYYLTLNSNSINEQMNFVKR
jgi:hypothetical protein